MRSPDGMSYKMATWLFEQGMECDSASHAIAIRLPALIREVTAEVRKERGEDYMSEKERDCIRHMDHGTGDVDGPSDPDCPCRNTGDECICAYNGCGFCRASMNEKSQRSNDGSY